MSKLNIAVIFGGNSDEYEVSLNSAANVIRALDDEKYEITKIGITRAGQWFVTKATPEEIESDKWSYGRNFQCILPHDPTVGGIYILDDENRMKRRKIDCIVPVLHGDHGEDGEIQGLFSLAKIPFVGPGVKASANCMDKAAAKELAKLVNVKMANHYLVRKRDYSVYCTAINEKIEEYFEHKLPLFVKPCSAGSSVGVTKVTSYADLKTAIKKALEFDEKVLVEETIVGREIEVAVLGNDFPVASSVGEILTAGEFYDYESKYINPESKTRVVDDLPIETIDEIRRYAVEIYRELDCKGLSRVDFFYTTEGEIVFNEINTLPGFTNISMYPQLWKHEGIETNELMDKLIGYALEEHEAWTQLERNVAGI